MTMHDAVASTIKPKRDDKPLTPTQRRILILMREHGMAKFLGGQRWFNASPVDMGVVIRAYQTPEFFMSRRGLIEEAATNAPGRWYRLSADGERRAASLKA